MKADTKELRELNFIDMSTCGYTGIFCGISVSTLKDTSDLNLFDVSAIGYDGIFNVLSTSDMIIKSSFNTTLF